MAVEKGKVLAALEIKYKGKSISKTFKENMAAKWAEKIDTDEYIDKYIEDRDEIILEAGSEADRRVTEATRKPNEPKTDPPKAEEPPKVDDAPEWAKAMLTNMQTLQSKIDGYEQKETAKSIEQRFKSDERLKGVPEALFKGRIPSKEDELENAISELATDWQGLNKQGFGNDNPGFSSKGSGQGEGKVDSDLAKFAQSQNAKFINETKN